MKKIGSSPTNYVLLFKVLVIAAFIIGFGISIIFYPENTLFKECWLFSFMLCFFIYFETTKSCSEQTMQNEYVQTKLDDDWIDNGTSPSLPSLPTEKTI